MVIGPDRLRKNRYECGEWLEALPYGRLSFNYVALARCVDGTLAVLKLFPPTDTEAALELEALTAFDGHRTVCLLAGDRKEGAMLLERIEPGWMGCVSRKRRWLLHALRGRRSPYSVSRVREPSAARPRLPESVQNLATTGAGQVTCGEGALFQQRLPSQRQRESRSGSLRPAGQTGNRPTWWQISPTEAAISSVAAR